MWYLFQLFLFQAMHGILLLWKMHCLLYSEWYNPTHNLCRSEVSSVKHIIHQQISELAVLEIFFWFSLPIGQKPYFHSPVWFFRHSDWYILLRFLLFLMQCCTLSYSQDIILPQECFCDIWWIRLLRRDYSTGSDRTHSFSEIPHPALLHR